MNEVEDFARAFERGDENGTGEKPAEAKDTTKEKDMADQTAEATKPQKPRINTDSYKAKLKVLDGKKAGENLASLRDDLRITEDEFQQATGITKQRLGNIEKDASSATFEELFKLSAAYEYTFGGLLKRIVNSK
jgi:DNA-binding XRE family transcriptional regulator